MQSASAPRRLSPAAAVVLLVFVLLLIGATIWLLWVPIQFLIIASLLALALSHPVDWLERRGIPRLAAIIGMLIIVLVVVGALAAVFLPRLVDQSAELINNLPQYLVDIKQRLQEVTQRYDWVQRGISELDVSAATAKGLRSFLGTGWQVALSVIGRIALAVMLLITVVFMLSNPKPLIDGIIGVVPEPWDERARRVGTMLADRLRAWIRGLVILGSVVGLAVGIGLSALGVPYAILFGVLAGLLEMIPTVGPVMAAIPPILVALAAEPVKALWVGALFIVVQQIENYLLVPVVMRRQLALHPVSTIFGFIALGKLFGLFGAIIAVPTVACLKVLYDEVYYPWAHPVAVEERPAAAEQVTPETAAANPPGEETLLK